MSVDTYLKGKNTSRYSATDHEGVKILVAPQLLQWAQAVQVGTKQFLIWRSFDIEAVAKPHKHGINCAH